MVKYLYRYQHVYVYKINTIGGLFMFNYNILNSKIQSSYQNYFHSLLSGLSVPKSKFIYQSLFGILKSNTCLLTNIARSLNEDITFGKTVDRLSRNFIEFDSADTLNSNYNKYLRNHNIIDKDPLFIVDDSDIAKPSSKHLEALDVVPDGSKSHDRTLGYWMTEIVALSKNNTPISTYSHIWSSKEDGFLSKNKILFDALDKNIKNFNNGTYVFDRYFDSNNLFKFMIKRDSKFIVRIKGNRSAYINGKIVKIKDLKYKGKIKFKRHRKDKNYYNKLTYTSCYFPGLKNEQLTLVLVYSDALPEPLRLITNKEVNGASAARKVASDYLKRWRIEEYFKFKKQEFDLENVRLRSLNGLRLINLLVTYVITFLAKYTNKSTWIAKRIHEISKPIKPEVIFNYYRVIFGIREIIRSVITKASDFIDNVIRDQRYRLRKVRQLNLFNYKYI